jgi:hypothetical protein
MRIYQLRCFVKGVRVACSQCITGDNGRYEFELRTLRSWILLIFCLASSAQAYGNEQTESRRHMGKVHRQSHGESSGFSGAVAGLLLGAANFPVILSVLLKASRKPLPQKSKIKEKLGRLNQLQKRYLMKLHYWLNPFAVGIAIIHFSAARCEATSMPELGLLAMLLISLLGFMVIFKLSPEFMRSAVLKLHTSPILTLAGFSILLIGHAMIN